jgi:hypothetical protein
VPAAGLGRGRAHRRGPRAGERRRCRVGRALEDFPAPEGDKVLDVNLTSPFFLTRSFLPLLKADATADDPARVINIGSIDRLRVPNYSCSAGKAALHHLTRVLAAELGHVTVNAVAPGPFESNMMAATLAEHGDAIAASSPLGRIGRPDDMARRGGLPRLAGGVLRDRRGDPGRRRHLHHLLRTAGGQRRRRAARRGRPRPHLDAAGRQLTDVPVAPVATVPFGDFGSRPQRTPQSPAGLSRRPGRRVPAAQLRSAGRGRPADRGRPGWR